MEIFFSSLQSISTPLLKVFLLGLAGYFIVKFNILNEESLRDLSRLLVNVILPCLIFSNIVTKFNPREFPQWWVFPLLQFLLFGIAFGLGWLITKIKTPFSERREFLGLITFQNGEVFPIALMVSLFPLMSDKYLVHIMLFNLFSLAVLYSLGVLLISKKKWQPENLKGIFTPVFISTAVSVLLVLTRVHTYVPGLILEPARIVGNCTVPLAMIVMGGVIYNNIKYRANLNRSAIAALALGKLVLLPLLSIGVIRVFNFTPDIAFIFFLEATMPPAISFAVLAQAKHGNHRFIGQAIFYIHILSMLTIPFFLTFYKILIGW